MSHKKESNWSRAVRNYFITTTLHGFKYLYSEFYIDRIVWIMVCCASTCCGGLLCAVLWERFLAVPALLELWDWRPQQTPHQDMPLVAICPSVLSSATILVHNLTSNASLAEQARNSLARVLSLNPIRVHRLQQLEVLLSEKNTSLHDLVFNHLPSCEQYILRCRWQYTMVPCEALFLKELTPWGICCVMRPNQELNAVVQHRATRYVSSTIGLDLALNCSDEPTRGCVVEETEKPVTVLPGYDYIAQLRYHSFSQNSADKLVGSACNSHQNYQRAHCLAKCAERACGCTNPLSTANKTADNRAPLCTVLQMECLRAHRNNSLCSCLPRCNKVNTVVTVESGRMDVLDMALDPIYSNLNASSTVIHVTVYNGFSRIFTMKPTETWLSLLSSLGGVFNMFLGVGLFSALELLFLIFIKLPKALKNTSEIINPPLSKY